MDRQNLRLLTVMALALTLNLLWASDDGSDPEVTGSGAPKFNRRFGSNGIFKPRAGSSDPDRDDGRRIGVIAKVYPGQGKAKIQQEHKLPGEMLGIHIHSLAAYRSLQPNGLAPEQPIKGDRVEFTVIDASHETSRCDADGSIIPKDGRVRADDIVKLGWLSKQERSEHPEYEMSQPLHEADEDWRSMAGMSTVSRARSQGARSKASRGRASTYGAASKRAPSRELDWATAREQQHVPVSTPVGSEVPTDSSPQEVLTTPETPPSYVPPHLRRHSAEGALVTSASRGYGRRHTAGEVEDRWAALRTKNREEPFSSVFSEGPGRAERAQTWRRW